MDLFVDMTAAVIETAIATIIMRNKTGSAEIKLSDIGRSGWIVGPPMVGEGDVLGLGLKVGVAT